MGEEKIKEGLERALDECTSGFSVDALLVGFRIFLISILISWAYSPPIPIPYSRSPTADLAARSASMS